MRQPITARTVRKTHAGTHHWTMERASAVALIPLSIWFVVIVLRLCHATAIEMLGIIISPFHTVMLVLCIMATLWHGQLGMRVIIDDYVHHRGMRLTFILLTQAATWITAVAGIVAVIVGHVSILG